VVTVHEVDTVFEGWGGDVVKKTGEGLLFVVREVPNNKCDGD
jgi:hypothetical protein